MQLSHAFNSIYCLLLLHLKWRDWSIVTHLARIWITKLLMLERVAEGALRSGSLIRGFQLKVPLVEHKMSLWIKEHLETSSTLKKLLLMLVLYGTSMVIVDGIVTPAMSGSYISVALFVVFLFTQSYDLTYLLSAVPLCYQFSSSHSITCIFFPVGKICSDNCCQWLEGWNI